MIAFAHPLAVLDTLDGYRQSFMDVTLWRPFLGRVSQGAGWTCNQVRPGETGTFPTFIIDEQRVIKFFGSLFDGETCWRVEQESARLLSTVPQVPVARLQTSGVLDVSPCWHYLVFEYVPGVSIGEVYTEISFEDKLALVRWLGGWLPRMHRTQVRGGTSLPALSAERVHGWFSSRWPDERRKWPSHLAEQVEQYLSANDGFFQGGSDCFIHADLTRDHFLGRLVDGHWSTMAVIDFGDAMLGNIYYELVALHLDLFDCDKRLLKTFLAAYSLPSDRDFVHKMMVTSLLHQFDVNAYLFALKPELREFPTLDELAERLWNVND